MKARERRCQICERAFRTVTSTRRNSPPPTSRPGRMPLPGIQAAASSVTITRPCAFAALSQGLCESHYGLWIRYRRLHLGAGQGWSSGPRPSPGRGPPRSRDAGWAAAARPCRTVADCAATTIGGGSKARTRTLTRRSGLAAEPVPARQPVLAAAAAPDAARVEFLYALQQRDTHGGDPTRRRCARPSARSLPFQPGRCGRGHGAGHADRQGSHQRSAPERTAEWEVGTAYDASAASTRRARGLGSADVASRSPGPVGRQPARTPEFAGLRRRYSWRGSRS